jgi:hypothetical protein
VEPFTGIWPFDTADEAAAAQEAVGRGHQVWLLDPARVSGSYARAVLGWRFPEVRQADPHTFEVTDSDSGAIVTMQVTQPVVPGEHGIWVITRVDHVFEGDLPSAVTKTRRAILGAATAGTTRRFGS